MHEDMKDTMEECMDVDEEIGKRNGSKLSR